MQHTVTQGSLSVTHRTEENEEQDVDTSFSSGNGRFYTVGDQLWRQATPDRVRCLCLDCLEVRIGRRLVADNFLATPLEILARMAGQEVEPLQAAERQRDLQRWRPLSA